ncbi:MAG: polyphosphate kinase 1, partial [Eubacterium sp.]|nr:polyphosphate kinase 1 [Eubacterium sp.]
MSAKTRNKDYMQNRELSWLKFDERVMDEAVDPTVPLLERLRFLTIFTTNLDEFFMVRVGSLIDMLPLGADGSDNKTGMTPQEQLDAIYAETRRLYAKRDELFNRLVGELRTQDIYDLKYDELTPSEQEYAENYFSHEIMPLLSPQIVDKLHPFPQLQNKTIAIGVLLKNGGKKPIPALLSLPSVIPDILYLPGNGIRFISTGDILFEFADVAFSTYEVLEKTKLCITRNADIHAEDEDLELSSDFRNLMKKMLRDRRHLSPLRMELSNEISPDAKKFLIEKLGLNDDQVYYSSAPLKLDFAYPLGDKMNEEQKTKLLYPPYQQRIPNMIQPGVSMFRQIQEHDLLLSYPYESMDPFLDLLDEASMDDDVVSISITIYRLARKSRLVHALCRAAENGKKVTVLIELRARFDEQNNIDWSEEFEKAGCNIIYGTPNYKVHSKLCLITRKEGKNIRTYTQVGTGNYNEKTSKL